MIAVADGVERRVSDPLAELADCRTHIEEIDLKLVALQAQRQARAPPKAGVKRAAGLPILDPRREAEVIRRAVVAAREKDLPTEPVRQIFWHIVGLSRRAQEETA